MIYDLETYRPPVRETPQVYFRRTEADRRPAQVVLRPNDGPGSNREEYAKEVAERLAQKSGFVTDSPERYEDRVRQRREATTLALLTFIAAHPEGTTGRRCVAFVQNRKDYVARALNDLASQGYITREATNDGSLINNLVTDQGRAYLANLK